MTTPLHQQIATIAKSDPAIHVSELILVNLITNRLDDALDKFVGFYRKYPDTNPIIQIGLKSCSYDRATAKWQLVIPPPGTQPGIFSVESTVGFTAEFAVAKVDDVKVELFTVTLTVNQMNALGAVEKGKISVKEPTLSSSTLLVEDANYEANLRACGLTDAQVKRLEGFIENSVVPVAFNNILRGAPSIDLQSLFPLITFQDVPEFDKISGGLLIVGRQSHLNLEARCPCGVQAPPIGATPGPSVPHPDPTTGGALPISINIPPPAKQVTENGLNGQISLYLPKATISSMTGGPYLAITGYIDDNGFIGYSLDYSVSLLSASLSLDDPRATLVLRVEFFLSAHGSVNVDLPCVGRTTIGRCWATNRRSPTKSYFEIGVSPVLMPDGRLVLQQQVLNVGVSSFDVDIVTVTPGLLGYLAGWAGGLYGFLIDFVLARVISMKLPGKLQDAVRDVMGNFNWTIFDISDFDLSILGGNFRALAAISRKSDSTLLGVALDR